MVQHKLNITNILPCAAASLLALDTFISVGPPKAWIHKVFGVDARLNPKKAQRLVSQLAARFVGAVFLAVMVSW